MQPIDEKARNIRLLILDVDGVLTSGLLYYGSSQMEIKGFFVRDGLGIKLLKKTGVDIAIISAKNKESTLNRMKELGIEHVYLGSDKKLPIYEKLKQKLALQDQEIAYMGDDLPDLPLLKRVGLAITVPEADELLLHHVHFVTKHQGGAGAVREVCDLLMKAQGTYEDMIESYLL